jgi:hypothetical protein
MEVLERRDGANELPYDVTEKPVASCEKLLKMRENSIKRGKIRIFKVKSGNIGKDLDSGYNGDPKIHLIIG